MIFSLIMMKGTKQQKALEALGTNWKAALYEKNAEAA
jgi:hypothetical protein